MRYTVTYTDSITGTENSRWSDFPGTYATQFTYERDSAFIGSRITRPCVYRGNQG